MGTPEGEWISEEGSGAFDWKLGIQSLVLISHRPEFGTRCKLSMGRWPWVTFLTSLHPHRLPLPEMELAIVPGHLQRRGVRGEAYVRKGFRLVAG